MIDEIRKAELRSGLKAYVESITQPDRKAGANMYKCPLCGSGQHGGRGSDGAGVKLDYQRDVNIVIKKLEDAIASMTTT